MTRKLKAVLHDGKKVAINVNDNPIFFDTPSKQSYFDALKSLLESHNTNETDLEHFLVNSLSVIFEDADSSFGATFHNRIENKGVDFTFKRNNNSGIAGVELKSHRMKRRLNEKQIAQHTKAFTNAYPNAEVLYLIGSDDYIKPDRNFGGLNGGISIKPLSWEGICNSLAPCEDDIPRATVYLVNIALYSRDLLRRLLQYPELLYSFDDRKFEEIIATLLFDIGLQDIEITETRAKSRDIIATHVDPISGNKEVYFIECKHWVNGDKITARWAFKLEKVVEEEEVTAGLLLSSSGFGPKLIEQEATFEKGGIYLRDTDNISNWLKIWERRYGSVLIEPVSPQDILGVKSTDCSIVTI